MAQDRPTIYKGLTIYKTGAAGGGGGGGFPDNIKQALYIEVVASTGSSSIRFPDETNINFSANDKLEFLFSTNNLTTSCDTGFFYGTSKLRVRLFTSEPKKLQVFYNSVQAPYENLANGASYRLTFDAGHYRINGTAIYNFSPIDQIIKTDIISMSGSGDIGNKFYSAELRDSNDNLKMRIIPALNTDNSKVCLYEVVGGTICYPNSNPGNWGLGALIPD